MLKFTQHALNTIEPCFHHKIENVLNIFTVSADTCREMATPTPLTDQCNKIEWYGCTPPFD